MRSGFSIGRIFGITINIDWSWLLIFILITWNLSTVFSRYHPDWNSVLTWSISIAAALLFFGSVLAHELAHSLVARAQGVPVRSITMFLFGGVSNIQREPPSPLAEFLITIVGPITSIVLGLIFSALTMLTSGSLSLSLSNPARMIRELNPLTSLLLWLGPVNIVVGLFNLIPGFPLDGGRVLRSIFWVISEDLRKATRWASWVGQFVAWVMIAAGISMVFGIRLPFFGTGLVNGLWLAFIGWFLNSASTQSYQRVVIKDILEGIPVERMMRTSTPSVHPTSSVSDLVTNYVMGTDEHAFPVMTESLLVGLVTLEDIRSVPRDQWDLTTVREIMTPGKDLVTISPNDDAAEALDKLTQRDFRQLPVVRDGELIGVIRRRDIMRWLQLQADVYHR